MPPDTTTDHADDPGPCRCLPPQYIRNAADKNVLNPDWLRFVPTHCPDQAAQIQWTRHYQRYSTACP